ncbi:MAG: flavodoxin family protein [Eubacterium sp.]|nr:flavodoxin family protein [Eubacterium sp.]
MKIVAVNGGPRKNCNTAQLLDSFLNGVREAAPDAEIEVIHVFGRIPYLPVLQKVQIITRYNLFLILLLDIIREQDKKQVKEQVARREYCAWHYQSMWKSQKRCGII